MALSLVHELSVLVPRDPRLRLALGLAVESDRLVARNHHVRRVFRDPRTPELPWNREKERIELEACLEMKFRASQITCLGKAKPPPCIQKIYPMVARTIRVKVIKKRILIEKVSINKLSGKAERSQT